MQTDLPREIALKIMYNINEKGAYSNVSVNKHLEAYELRDIDKAFITELVYGTEKWKLTLDWIIEQFSSIKLKKMSPWILNILRLGIYQLIYTDKVPESAAVNESVKLSKKYGHTASSGFVNAVLRNISRKRNEIRYPDKEKEPVRFLSVKYSHPQWLVQKWLGRYGYEFTESLLDSNNGVPVFTVRVNTLKTTREQLVQAFREAGMEAGNGAYVQEAVTVENPQSFAHLDAFRKGHFQVQDESSMLVARVLDPKPGELVMDVCSAPGGKSIHIAQLMGNQGTVIARDIHEHKIKLIKEAAERLGITIITTELFDATLTDDRYVDKADRVLVDAPCTGLGIIRRKPDIKWTRNVEDKKEIVRLQLKILSAASKYVKSGGVLVYSTCTIEPEENDELVKSFLKDNKGFEPVDISPVLPVGLVKPTAADGYIQLFPNIDKVDGFFITKMIRNAVEK